MKLAVTKREKIMLIIVVLIAVIYLAIQFVIIPLSTRYREDLVEQGRLQDEIDVHKIEAATIPGLRERNAEALEKFNNLISGYPVIVDNEELDFMLTSLSNNNNLRPTSLRITPRPARPPPAEVEDGARVLPELEKATVQMSVVGTYRSLMNLLDDVSGIQHMRLTNVSYAENIQLPEQSRITATYEITFLSDLLAP